MSLPADRRAVRQTLMAVTLLLLVTGLLYGHTLHVPFYLDDNVFFNEAQRGDLSAALRNLLGQRGLTNLTFALNYRVAGWALPPLHLVNIALHAGCAVALWLVLRRLVGGVWLPVAGAIFFVVHPLQTQAVTYVIQRGTVLGALFFVLAFFCHLQAREARLLPAGRRSSRYQFWSLCAVLSGACAVLAKENTALLPLLLMTYDYLFPPPGERCLKQATLDYAPFFLAPLLLGGAALYTAVVTGDGFALSSEVQSLRHNSPLHYFITEFSVFWVYLRLLLLPFGQALLHNYPVSAEFLTWQNSLALAGLLSLWLFVWRSRRRRPLLALGVAWFFLTLAVESTFIPLDPLYEHRLYLPLAGFVLVLLDIIPVLCGQRLAWAIWGTVLLVCAPLTWQRNALWRDPIAFYAANVATVPDSERALEYLGMEYGKAGDYQRALDCLQRAMKLNPQDASLFTNMGVIHSWRGDDRQALIHFEQSLRLAPRSEKTQFNYAATLFTLGDKRKAFEVLGTVLQLNPANADAQYGRGTLAAEYGSRQDQIAARDVLRRLGDQRAGELDALLGRGD